MKGWLLKTEEGEALKEIMDSLLLFFACILCIATGFLALIALRPDIQAGLRAAERLCFG
jgi:hypothetical protein